MHNFTLKNIPDDLYIRIKKQAAANHRSINGEVIYCMEQYVSSYPFNPQPFLAELEQLQASLTIPPLTDEILAEARAERK